MLSENTQRVLIKAEIIPGMYDSGRTKQILRAVQHELSKKLLGIS